MDTVRGAVGSTTAVLLLTAVVSGPLVPAVDFTPPPDAAEFNPYPGRFDATVVDLPPDPLVFVRRGDRYRLTNATAVLEINAIDGTRSVLYNLLIPGVGTSVSANTVVTRSQRGERVSVTYTNVTVPASRVNQSAYVGVIRIYAVFGTDEHIVYGTNVRVVFRNP